MAGTMSCGTRRSPRSRACNGPPSTSWTSTPLRRSETIRWFPTKIARRHAKRRQPRHDCGRVAELTRFEHLSVQAEVFDGFEYMAPAPPGLGTVRTLALRSEARALEARDGDTDFQDYARRADAATTGPGSSRPYASGVGAGQRMPAWAAVCGGDEATP